MTSFQIAQVKFSRPAIATWRSQDEKHQNWPVIYVLDNYGYPSGRSSNSVLRDIYVGESLNAVSRLRQHLETPAKQHLKNARVILHEKYNKSVCLDLESYLIRMMAGDGANQALNRHNGITDAQYYQKEAYHAWFRVVFEQLRSNRVSTRSIPEIQNSSLSKLSPDKALTEGNADSVEEILTRFFVNLSMGGRGKVVLYQDDRHLVVLPRRRFRYPISSIPLQSICACYPTRTLLNSLNLFTESLTLSYILDA